MTEWKEDKCLLLIEAYQQNPQMWNPKDYNYYKKDVKDDTWAKIGLIVNESPEICKQKMINLLASYRRERMKVKKSMGPGNAINSRYESKWYAYKALTFLNSRYIARKEIESYRKQIQEEATQAIEGENKSLPSEPVAKRVKLNPKLEQLKETIGMLTTSLEKPNQDKELQVFLEYIGEIMKKFSRVTKSAIQLEIMQIILRADQEYYQQQASSSKIKRALTSDDMTSSNNKENSLPQESTHSPCSNHSPFNSDHMSKNLKQLRTVILKPTKTRPAKILKTTNHSTDSSGDLDSDDDSNLESCIESGDEVIQDEITVKEEMITNYLSDVAGPSNSTIKPIKFDPFEFKEMKFESIKKEPDEDIDDVTGSNDFVPDSQSPQINDEYSAFGELIALRLRNLPISKFDQARRRINCVLDNIMSDELYP